MSDAQAGVRVGFATSDSERLQHSDHGGGAGEDTDTLPGAEVDESEAIGGHATEGGLGGGGQRPFGEVGPELAGGEVHERVLSSSVAGVVGGHGRLGGRLGMVAPAVRMNAMVLDWANPSL